MYKKYLILFIGLCTTLEISAQYSKRKDYDLALGVVAGLNSSFALPHNQNIRITPALGLELTIPISRIYFLGTGINYSEFKYKQKHQKESLSLKSRSISIPLIFKHMLPNNKSILLLGGYFAYNLDNKITFHSSDISNSAYHWNGGGTVGVEQTVTKNFHFILNMNGGFNKIVDTKYIQKKYYPFSFNFMIGYTFSYLGDCGCR